MTLSALFPVTSVLSTFSRLRYLMLSLVLSVLLLPTGAAQAQNPSGLVKGYVYSQLGRLKLTTPQRSKLRRILSRSFASLGSMCRRLNVRLGQKVGILKGLKLQRHVRGLGNRTRSQVARFLKPTQLRTFDSISREAGRLLKRKLT